MQDALYAPPHDLPRYLMIGPPGAGKTAALINSGIKFRLAGDNAAQGVQDIGKPRYFDWWLTDQAALIDTAGRYTTQNFRSESRSQELVCSPRPTSSESSAPTYQRSDRRHQHLRHARPFGAPDECARRRHTQAPRRTARRPESRCPGVCCLHQDGPARWLHGIFC